MHIKQLARNLTRNAWFLALSAISTVACVVFAAITFDRVTYDISYDKFHNDYNSIYRIVSVYRSNNGIEKSIETPFPLAAYLKEQYPSITNATQYYWEDRIFQTDAGSVEKKMACVDPDFFTIFNFVLEKGSIDRLFSKENCIILSHEMAQELFPGTDPIGKELRNTYLNKRHLVVGVFAPLPSNTHLSFDCITSMDDYGFQDVFGWNYSNRNTTYIKLASTLPPNFESQIAKLPAKVYGQQSTLWMQPLTNIHLHTSFNDGTVRVSYTYLLVHIFSTLLLLIISCVNLSLLYLALYVKRVKEIQVKLFLGAKRWRVIYEQLLEIVVVALGVATLSYIAIKAFDNNFSILLWMKGSWSIAIFSLIAAIIITILASISSVFFMLRLETGNRDALKLKPKNRKVRLVLIGLQIIFAMLSTVSSAIFLKQMNYLKQLPKGMNLENVLAVKSHNFIYKINTIRDQLEQNPCILSVSGAGELPFAFQCATSKVSWEGKSSEESIVINYQNVEHDYLKALSLNMVEGNFIPKGLTIDDHFDRDTGSVSFVLNQEAAKQMGLTNPVGKRFEIEGFSGRIVGVIKDFHFNSVKESIKPLVLFYNPECFIHIFVKYAPNRRSETITAIQEVVKPYNTFNFPIEIEDLSTMPESQFVQEEYMAKLLLALTVATAIFSLLGIISISNFLVIERSQEVGIRKVLGATSTDIHKNFVVEFLWVFALCVVITLPLLILITNRWLVEFPYRIGFPVTIIVAVNFVILLVTTSILLFHGYRLAKVDPVKILKKE